MHAQYTLVKNLYIKKSLDIFYIILCTVKYLVMKTPPILITLILLSINNAVFANFILKNWYTKYPALQVPQNTQDGFYSTGNRFLELENNSWQEITPSDYQLKANKSVTLRFANNGMKQAKSNYNVLYRIDPRFDTPQVFIDPKSEILKEDAGKLAAIFTDKTLDFQSKVSKLKDYFSKNSSLRKKIPVKEGDIINITLKKEAIENIRYNQNNNLRVETDDWINNKILYTPSEKLCAKLYPDTDYDTETLPPSCTTGGNYTVSSKDTLLFGTPTDDNLRDIVDDDDEISDKYKCQTFNTQELCAYQDGIGMEITLNNTIIKDKNTPFIALNDNTLLFRHKAQSDGEIDFTSPTNIKGMFVGGNSYWEKDEENKDDKILNFVYFGSYSMQVSIGGADVSGIYDEIKLEYLIDDKTPDDKTSGITIKPADEQKFNAPKVGRLFIRITEAKNLKGSISVSYAAYTGGWTNKSVEYFSGGKTISGILYYSIVNPLHKTFVAMSTTLYSQISTNLDLLTLARAVATLYVCTYGIYFTLGISKITASELLKIIFKLLIVFKMLQRESWEFFNVYLFDVFLNSTDFLIKGITQSTSDVNNIFGFMDPLLDFYFNPSLWLLIFIEILSFWKGTTPMGMLILVAFVNSIAVMLDIIMQYLLAMLSISILISLAPIIIIFLLFDYTKAVFHNWIKIIVSYVMLPFFTFLFFLTLQQILMTTTLMALMPAAWAKILKFAFEVPIYGETSIPGLPGIAFYQSEYLNYQKAMSATFMLFCLSMIIRGSIGYMGQVTSTILGGVGTSSAGSNITQGLNQKWGIEKSEKPNKQNQGKEEKNGEDKDGKGGKDGGDKGGKDGGDKDEK